MKSAKIIALLSAAAIAMSFSACRDDYTKEGGEITTADIELLKQSTETTFVEEELVTGGIEKPSEVSTKLVLDREGTLVDAPVEINRIVSGSESVTEILVSLGLGGKIVAADKDSAYVAGVSPSICTLNKKIITASAVEPYEPDVVILSGTSSDTMYNVMKDSGVNVICVPQSSTIEGIKLDIQFLAEYLSVENRGTEIVDEIDGAIVDVMITAETIGVRRKVYFEEEAIPNSVAYGSGTIENEIISLVGAENILAAKNGTSVIELSEVVAANPDVILTKVNYDGYDISEISARPGWTGITAVLGGSVHQIGEVHYSNLIVESIYEIARAIYPEVYTE